MAVVWRLGDQWQARTPVVDRQVRYVGQPLAIVVAHDRTRAADAAEQVVAMIDERPAVVDATAALAPGAPLLYPERGTNRLASFATGTDVGPTGAAFAAADHVLRTTIVTPRLSGAPIEPRGIVVDPSGDRLAVWSSNQGGHAVRDGICGRLVFRSTTSASSRPRSAVPSV